MKGVKELALSSWWILEDRGSETSPASHHKGASEPLRRNLCLGAGVFHEVLKVEKYMVDRHGRSAVVVMYMLPYVPSAE